MQPYMLGKCNFKGENGLSKYFPKTQGYSIFGDVAKISAYVDKDGAKFENMEMKNVILPHGVYCAYVSADILNAFVNQYKPVKCFLLNRYVDWDTPYVEENGEEKIVGIRQENPVSIICGDLVNEDNEQWPTYKFRCKSSLHSTLSKLTHDIHSKLDVYGDDILMLAYSEERKEYVVFHFDMDVSDCCIGRFMTEDKQEDVIAGFTDFAQITATDLYLEAETGQTPKKDVMREIPASTLHSCMSF